MCKDPKVRELTEYLIPSSLPLSRSEACLALFDSVARDEVWFDNAMKLEEEELERERYLSKQRKSTEDGLGPIPASQGEGRVHPGLVPTSSQG